MARSIGNRLVPARFVAFMLVLVAATPAAAWKIGDVPLGIMIGFNAAALLFLMSCVPLLRVDDARTMRDHAARDDANRTVLLVITSIVMAAILAAVAAETMGGIALDGWMKALVVATLLVAWLFANTIYALHYAHLFYVREGGIEFPKTEDPVYSDFVYFAFTLGMTFQTSDVVIADPGIRRIVTLHCFAAFVFNLGVLAFTINVLGGQGA